MFNSIKTLIKSTASKFTTVNHQCQMRASKALQQDYSKGNIRTVFDIGAHQGCWTDAHKKLMPSARFILFEANPDQAPIIQEKGHEHYISILTKPGVCELDFYTTEPNSPGSTGSSYFKEVTGYFDEIKPMKLRAATLAETCFRHELPLPDLIKIDTQGSELDIIKGGEEQFRSARWIIIEIPLMEYNLGSPKMTDYMKSMEELGFVPVELVETHHFNTLLIQIDLLFTRKDLVDMNTSKALRL